MKNQYLELVERLSVLEEMKDYINLGYKEISLIKKQQERICVACAVSELNKAIDSIKILIELNEKK